MTTPTGRLIIITGISGGGKSTLTRLLKERHPELMVSVSVTTRQPREGEQYGRDYYFVSDTIFEWLKQTDQLLESAQVYDAWYGIPRSPIEKAQTDGHDVLLTIDAQGAKTVKQRFPEAVILFLAPPDNEAQQKRLHDRTMAADDLAIRLQKSVHELAWAREAHIPIIYSHSYNQVLRDAEAILFTHHSTDAA